MSATESISIRISRDEIARLDEIRGEGVSRSASTNRVGGLIGGHRTKETGVNVQSCLPPEPAEQVRAKAETEKRSVSQIVRFAPEAQFRKTGSLVFHLKPVTPVVSTDASALRIGHGPPMHGAGSINPWRSRLAPLKLLALALTVVVGLTAGSAEAKKKAGLPPIHVRGTVYTFDDQTPIAGATVMVAELPGVSAQTGPDGSYDLVVPDGTKFTPFADSAGHHRIYLQTYVSQGKDLERVNFQMPSDAAYNLLALILSAPLNANNELVNCAVVSTFSTTNVRDVSFNDFVAYGAHGVAGATASASPALPNPVYFNESVIPDASRTASSVDGGVVWPVVPPGVYRFTAQHPSTRFAPFRATCEPGRVVNANPPQGFYELRPGETVDSSVAASLASTHFDFSGSKARLKVRVKAREYVAVSGVLRRGKKARAKRRTEGYAPGKRTLAFPIGKSPAGKQIAVKLTMEDGQGNVKALTPKLKVPGR